MGVEVIGCSFDKPAVNKVFKDNEKFQFELFSDTERELGMYYGAADSKTAWFAKRVTVVLDPQGNWILNYPSVSPKAHPGEVLADMKAILN